MAIRLIDQLEQLLDTALSEVGRTYHVLPLDLELRPLAWIMEEFRRLQRRQFEQVVLNIRVVEAGVNRALAAAFGEKVPELPRWGEAVERQPERTVPEWWIAYQKANPQQKIRV